MIAFIVALEKEAQPILECFEKIKISTLSSKKVYHGKFNNEKCILIVTDIGKVSASLGTQAVIDKYSPSLIVNFGSCGAIEGKERQFYCVTESCQYDLDLSDIDNVSVGYNQGYDKIFFPSTPFNTSIERAKLATSDRFTCKEKDIETIRKLNCQLFDMEGGAIAQTCFSNNTPFICIKGVSDVFGSGNNGEQYYQNVQEIMKNLPKILIKTLNEYKKK